MSVSVVDESGRLVYYARSDGTGFFTFDTSRAKAMEITDNKDANPLLWYSLPSPGGLPIKKDGRVIGANGIGGGSPQEDHDCALAGATVMH